MLFFASNGGKRTTTRHIRVSFDDDATRRRRDATRDDRNDRRTTSHFSAVDLMGVSHGRGVPPAGTSISLLSMMMLSLLCILAVVASAVSAFQPESAHRRPTVGHRNENRPNSNKICSPLESAQRRSTVGYRKQICSPLAAYVDISENFYRDVASMDEWATACGVQKADGFQLTSEEGPLGLDFSVMTTVDMAEGSPVVFVSNEMIFASNQIEQELGPYAQEAVGILRRLSGDEDFELRHIQSHFYLFLKILMEYEKGDQSPWFSWLNSLPRTYYNGASMTPFCYECLPPLMGSLAMGERVKFINFCQAVKKADFISEETTKNIHNNEVVKWAFQIATTRSFEGDDNVSRIVPLGDYFDHSANAEVAMNFDEEGNCVAYTTMDVRAGSPLRISYCDSTNPSYIFARYGFLDESSPATFCKIMIPNVSSELVDMGYDFSRMLFYKDGQVSEEVWDVLLYQYLSDGNVGVRRQLYEAHMNGDIDTKRAIHSEYYPQTLEALRNHVDDFLGQLDELSAKGEGKSVAEHPRLPMILQHNDFVRQTFLAVKATL